jgi:hypothetical protein
MKKIFLIILFLSLNAAKASDGWWERIDTPHNPENRARPAMDIISENKVLMFGGYGYYPYQRDSLKQNEFWIFDYNQKDWIKTNIKFPFEYQERYDEKKLRHALGSMANIEDGKMLISFGEKQTSFKETDSTLWELNVNTENWIFNKQNSWPYSSNDNVNPIYYYKLNDSLFITSAYNNSEIYNLNKRNSLPTDGFGNFKNYTCAVLGNGKFLMTNNLDNFKPYDPFIPIYEQVIKFWYFDVNNPNWELHPILNGNEYKYARQLNSNVISLISNAVNLTMGKVKFVHSFNEVLPDRYQFSKNSHIFDFSNLGNPLRLMNIDTIGPPAEMRGFTLSKLAKDKILFYGGWIDPGSSQLPLIIPPQTWVFHIDPEITNVEVIDLDKKVKTKQIMIDSKFEIMTLNDKIIKHKLFDLLGNEINNYKVEDGLVNTSINLTVPNGTYLFTFELINGEKFNFLILVQH